MTFKLPVFGEYIDLIHLHHHKKLFAITMDGPHVHMIYVKPNVARHVIRVLRRHELQVVPPIVIRNLLSRNGEGMIVSTLRCHDSKSPSESPDSPEQDQVSGNDTNGDHPPIPTSPSPSTGDSIVLTDDEHISNQTIKANITPFIPHCPVSPNDSDVVISVN